MTGAIVNRPIDDKKRPEQFPIGLSRATGFLNALGRPVGVEKLPADYKQFLVEGERRHFAQSIAAATDFTWKKPLDVQYILSDFAPAGVLHPLHLDPSDRGDVLPLHDPVSDKPVNVLRLRNSPLTLWRGTVTTVRFEFTIRVQAKEDDKSDNWIVKPAVSPVDASWLLPKSLLNDDPVGATLRGTGRYVTGSGMAKSVLLIDAVEKVPAEKESKFANSFVWVLPLNGNRFVVVNQLKPLAGAPEWFLDPKKLVDGELIEAVGTPQPGGRLEARAWPLAAFGTLTVDRTDDKKLEYWHFDLPDGTRLNGTSKETPAGSGFYQLRAAAGGGYTFRARPIAPPFVVAAEVVATEAREDSSSLVQLASPASGAPWTLHCRPNDEFPSTLTGAPPRRAAVDLEFGDFVIAVVEMESEKGGPLRPGRMRIVRSPDTGLCRLRAGLIGSIARAGSRELLIAAEGTPEFGRATVTTPLGQRRTVWHPHAQAKETPLAAFACAPVVWARTVVKYEPPSPPHTALGAVAGAAIATRVEQGGTPVHAAVSPLIATWNGWSLTVPVAGDSDTPENNEPVKDAPFQIKCYLPDLDEPGVHPELWSWPALRFGKSYEFCVRRSDMAGNHLYDEPLPAKTDAKVASSIEPWWSRSKMLRERWETRKNAEPEPFLRSDRPVIPLLAFATGAEPAAGRAMNESGPDDDHPLRLEVNKERDARLVLVTDVLNRDEPVTTRASAFLLPPPASVDTVLTHGAMDWPAPSGMFAKSTSETTFRYIEIHERHFERGTGLDRCGWLTYFGDPAVGALHCGLRSGKNKPIPAKPLRFFSTAPLTPPWKWPWPWPREVRLVLEKGGAKPLGGSIVVEDTEAQQVVRYRLPPGAVASAEFATPLEKDADSDALPKLEVPLIHATNGPLTRPAWAQKLMERQPASNDTSRSFEGDITLDASTTGAWTATAYWNDPWDETVPALYIEAKVEAEVIGNELKAIHVRDSGAGYGRMAIVVLMSKGRHVRTASFEAVTSMGGIQQVVLHGKPPTVDPGTTARVLRRPPFHAVAEGRAEVNAQGGIERVDVTKPGGWYTAPPLVVVHDEDGDGREVELRAHLNDQGGVDRVEVRKKGRLHSKSVRVAFYTNQQAFPEVTVPFDPNAPEAAPAARPIAFDHPFGDTRARRVDYVVSLVSRFREILNELKVTHLPRHSPTRMIEVSATSRPPEPEVAYLMPAFQWRIAKKAVVTLDPVLNHFCKLESGRIEVRREACIRVYLERPWHASGAELLGVVVMPAELNTARIQGGLGAGDGGAFNIARHPELRATPAGVTDYIIPAKMRSVVSRWGFDPVWGEAALPPLNTDHFPQKTSWAQDDLVESAADDPRRPRIALHEVSYDSEKDLWYADVRVLLQKDFDDLDAEPFFQLAVVRYQPAGLPGLRISPVCLCDPIKLATDRTLVVERKDTSEFTVAFRGGFEKEKPGRLPRRLVKAELRGRDSRFPAEVEAYVPPGATADDGVHAKHLLSRTAAGHFRGRFTIPADALTSASAQGSAVLVIKETELYPTSEDQRDRTGSTSVIVDGRQCMERVVFSATMAIGTAVAPAMEPPKR